jgi:spore maturation protein CgeB
MIDFDMNKYTNSGLKLAQKIRIRTQIGRCVDQFNDELINVAEEKRPDIVWFDKATFVRADTVRKIKGTGAYTIHYNSDNPFGPRKDPGWRTLLSAIAEYDLHLVVRISNIAEYKNSGAHDVRYIDFAFEPAVHFPPPEGWSDRDRLHDVTFVGSPFDERANFLAELWRKFGIKPHICGDTRMWRKALSKYYYMNLGPFAPVWNDDYRKTIWQSRICLSFVTHSNLDETAHRSFEIAASGGFMLVEDTAAHRERFEENKEAIFFKDVRECAEKIRRYLPDGGARRRIASAACKRAHASGYDNDSRLALILESVKSKVRIADDIYSKAYELDAKTGKKHKIIYVGTLERDSNSYMRYKAIVNIGHDVIPLNIDQYLSRGSNITRKIRARLLFGGAVNELNDVLMHAAKSASPDIIWFDKATYLNSRTVRELRKSGCYLVHYNPDNPFGPRRDPGWRLFNRAIPEYNLHLVPRHGNICQYREVGAKDVRFFPFTYEPSIHYPPPREWSDRDRCFDVIFIGSPYDNRAETIVELWERYGIRTTVWGDKRMWLRALPQRAVADFCPAGPLLGGAYREAIWKARICLAFVTHSNQDEQARRSFEIAACGGFMLLEDAPGHRANFSNGKEAIYFTNADDCAAQIRRYLHDEEGRSSIARAAARRVSASGHDNETRIRRVFQYIDSVIE